MTEEIDFEIGQLRKIDGLDIDLDHLSLIVDGRTYGRTDDGWTDIFSLIV